MYNRYIMRCSGESTMMYSSKSIKLNFFCRKLYEHTFNVLDINKPILSTLFIVQNFGEEYEKPLARYMYNELFVEMIQDMEKYTPAQVLELKQEISKTQRLTELKKIFDLDNSKNPRANLSFRIPVKVKDNVKKIKESSGIQTISEVCELAIMNFVNKIDEAAFNIIKISLTKEFNNSKKAE